MDMGSSEKRKVVLKRGEILRAAPVPLK